MNEIAPILIVGAGPVGLVLAHELLRRQVPCRLIDRKAKPETTSRSFTLHARTLEMLEDFGVVNEILEDGIKARGFYFHFQGRDEHPTLDFTTLSSRYPYVLVYNQNQTEQRLRNHLRETYDCNPEWGVELIDLEQDRTQLRATLRHCSQGDSEETIAPRWIVGCDGIHSTVRQAAGLHYTGEDYSGMVMQMMDTRCLEYPDPDHWTHYYIAKDHFLLMTKLPSGNHRVLISDMGETDNPDLQPPATFQPYVEAHVPGTILAQPEWATKWQIWKRLAEHFHRDNIFIAGDAAHVHSPSGGQGMNLGMADAYNLGWKLALVARGEAKRTLLDSYEKERKPIADLIIRNTDAVHDIIMDHGTAIEERLAKTRDPKWHDEAVGRISGISHSYRDSNGLARDEGSGPPIGDRAPDAQLTPDIALYDVIQGPLATLLLLPAGHNDQAVCRDIGLRMDRSFGHIVKLATITLEPMVGIPGTTIVIDDLDNLTSKYGNLDQGRWYLIRPDAYIGARARLTDAGPLFDYLNNYFVDRTTRP